MAQPFSVKKTELRIGPRKGETVYYAQAYYFGTISTQEVATQISQESALTQADVIGVIERLGYFCKTHAALGYRIKIDGMGMFYNELLTTGSVTKEEDVTARLIKCVRPAFSPEYNVVNKSFRYVLLPEKVELVKIDFKNAKASSPKGEEGSSGAGGSTEEDIPPMNGDNDVVTGNGDHGDSDSSEII